MQTASQFGRRGNASAPPPARSGRPAQRTTTRAVNSDSTASFLLVLLFGFEGRVDRGVYRLCRICAYVSFLIVWSALRAVIPNVQSNLAEMGVLLVVELAVILLMIWTTLAMQVKRWHDRDRAWPWLFVGFIPLVGWLWVLIELNFLEGTLGPNRFGASPKGDPSTVFA